MLKVRNVYVFQDEKEILQNINLDFKKGHIYSLFGKNGSGKTTLARTLMGFNIPEHGEIVFNSKDITNADVTTRAKMGMTITQQEPVRFEGISTVDYITLNNKFASDNLEEIFEIVGLEFCEYKNRNVDKSLSGGERKRIELAAALKMEPKVVILDEPDSGIDYLSITNIINILNYIKERGGTAIIITHNEDIASIADYSYLICDNTIKKFGRPYEIAQYYRKKCTTCPVQNEGGDLFGKK